MVINSNNLKLAVGINSNSLKVGIAINSKMVNFNMLTAVALEMVIIEGNYFSINYFIIKCCCTK